MLKQPLHQNWNVRCVGDLSEVPSNVRDVSIPAQVPGCVHTDLMRAGLIEDPYFGLNEPKLIWIGNTDWQYSITFDADPKLFDHERIDLVCDGLDTVATIVLNGSIVAQTQNMHRGYRFDVRPLLKKGRNELAILFASPVKYAARMRDKLGYLPGIFYGGAYNFIRKMACNFGWDWGPIVPTCGIWRGIRLEGWSIARVASVFPVVTAACEEIAELKAHMVVERSNTGVSSPLDLGLWLTMTGAKEPSVEAELTINPSDIKATIELKLRNPNLWWPRGHGDYFLYHLEVGILSEKEDPGEKIWPYPREHDWWVGRIGLRTVELDTSPDDIGRKFVVKVNGKPIFCKGFNWIPDDCFLDRACKPERYRKRIQQALDANANMLRVWGGGIYETDEFYDICDEKGMLVWQDFLFACAAYPEDEPFKSEVEAEARYNVARLSHHPSLVLWNGCNENLWMYRDLTTDDGTGKQVKWLDQLANKKWGVGYYLDLLPKVVKELDPSRPYWAASPWSGDPDVTNGIHPNLATHGNKHIWEVWHGPGDYNNYRQFAPRFCSEFGYQGPANYSTMRKYFDPPTPSPGTPGEGGGEGSSSRIKSRPTSPQNPHPNPLPEYRARGQEKESWAKWLAMHQKSPGGNERNDRLLLKDFDLPADFDDLHYLLQLNQARALKAGVEWFRSRKPVCMGTLYWQLNDCYPVTSWSAIDSEGRLKPLWYATRKFFSPKLLTIQPDGFEYKSGDPLTLFALDDLNEPAGETVRVRRMKFDGTILAEQEANFSISTKLLDHIYRPADPHSEFIIAGENAFWFFAPDKSLNYPPADFSAEFKQNQLTIQAKSFIRDIVISPDRLDPAATISDNVVTLLPGESFTFVIDSSKELRLEQLITPPVFQCVNRLGKNKN